MVVFVRLGFEFQMLFRWGVTFVFIHLVYVCGEVGVAYHYGFAPNCECDAH